MRRQVQLQYFITIFSSLQVFKNQSFWIQADSFYSTKICDFLFEQKKQLLRRGKIGTFLGHRKNNQLHKKQLFCQQSRPQKKYQDYSWYCPTCFGDFQYQFPQELDQLIDLGEEADQLIYASGDSVLQKLQNSDMWLYQELNLNQSRVTDRGIKYLSSGLWDGLLKLSLGFNQIKDKACKYLATMSLPYLQTLDLGFNDIHSQGIRYLSKGNLPSLKKLILQQSCGIRFLIKAQLPGIQEICFEYCFSKQKYDIYYDFLGLLTSDFTLIQVYSGQSSGRRLSFGRRFSFSSDRRLYYSAEISADSLYIKKKLTYLFEAKNYKLKI